MDNWMVAVFNHDTARFFSGADVDQLNENLSLICPEARVASRELYSDAPSRTQDSFSRRHSFEPRTDAREKYMKIFAQEIAECLEQARETGHYKNLVLIAPPDMLGVVRKGMSPDCLRLIQHEYKKNLVKLDIQTILKAVSL